MDIQQEPAETNAIQSYSEKSITIQNIAYNTSTLITASRIIVNWSVHTVQDLSPEHFSEILELSPEIILIGHNQLGKLPSPHFIQAMGVKRIGVECMSIGAACRTFNVLLSENRKVVLGFIIA